MRIVKRLAVAALVIAILAAGFLGIKKYRDSKVEVEVVPVANLSWGWFGDETSIEGMVYDQDSQALYPSSTQIIEEVFVTQGQEVKAGDKLLAYDNSSQEITLELRQLAVRRAEVALENAQRELNKLYNTKPISYNPVDPEPEPEPEPQPEPEPIVPKKEKTKDAWNILDEGSINSFYLKLDDLEDKLKEEEEARKEAEEKAKAAEEAAKEAEEAAKEAQKKAEEADKAREEAEREKQEAEEKAKEAEDKAKESEKPSGGDGGTDGGSSDSGADSGSSDGGTDGGSDSGSADGGTDGGADSGSADGGSDAGSDSGATDGGADDTASNSAFGGAITLVSSKKSNNPVLTLTGGILRSGSGEKKDEDNKDSQGPAPGEDEENKKREPNEPGGKKNPWRYIVTKDGVVYGSFLNKLRERNGYAVIEVHEGNTQDGDILASWWIDTELIKAQHPDDHWYLIMQADDSASPDDQMSIDELIEDGDAGSFEPYVPEMESGYTAEELAEAISYMQREIKDLDLSRRRAVLDLKALEEELADGFVRAKSDGVITFVGDINNPPTDGSPFLIVEAGEGVMVQGTLPELMLDSVQIGQELTIRSWETGETYYGTIKSIDDYPAENDFFFYGSGNPNSSNYGFLAYVEDGEGLTSGMYLQLSLDTADVSMESALTLPVAYIRSDNQGKYVMKTEEGVLKKQYIKCGKTYYGEATVIEEGITEEDWIAFPYGDGAMEGAKTIESEGGMGW